MHRGTAEITGIQGQYISFGCAAAGTASYTYSQLTVLRKLIAYCKQKISRFYLSNKADGHFLNPNGVISRVHNIYIINILLWSRSDTSANWLTCLHCHQTITAWVPSVGYLHGEVRHCGRSTVWSLYTCNFLFILATSTRRAMKWVITNEKARKYPTCYQL